MSRTKYTKSPLQKQAWFKRTNLTSRWMRLCELKAPPTCTNNSPLYQNQKQSKAHFLTNHPSPRLFLKDDWDLDPNRNKRKRISKKKDRERESKRRMRNCFVVGFYWIEWVQHTHNFLFLERKSTREFLMVMMEWGVEVGAGSWPWQKWVHIVWVSGRVLFVLIQKYIQKCATFFSAHSIHGHGGFQFPPISFHPSFL